ncbi:MAG: coproporphyrinogen dehydrogenase [Novosphingobium sp.]|nr:coproporphyrinogen dehydrogenase [Novosphingobium sp.]
MWPYYPELLETPVPRYTSFPTAAEFGDGVGAVDFAQVLEGTTGDVSLYVHIPFCEQICWYCGCNTSAANKRSRLESYLSALHREIKLVGDRLPNAARITRIAFGGGSPNAIEPLDFVRLVDALTAHFGAASPVISIELDPRTLGGEWLPVLRAIGVTNASLGVQTFALRLQEAIGRVQPLERIARVTDMLREAGVTSLNYDLMYGLPGQTMGDLEDTLGHADRLGADRIALFGYAHVPHLIPRQRQIVADDLPDQKVRFDMAARGHDLLAGEGYVPVGFDHFARPGDPIAKATAAGALHRNFQGFTDDAAPVLLGLGATAISMFPELLVQNEKNAGRYSMLLSQDRFTANRGIRRSRDDRMRGDIIERLLCSGTARIEPELLRETQPFLLPFMERGLVSLEDDVCTIASDGLPYTRTIAAQFDPYRKDSQRRFSSAV